MKCPKCSVEVTHGDRFCKSCGGELPEPESPPKRDDPSTADALRSAKGKDDGTPAPEEVQLWEGRYSIKEGANVWFMLACALLGILIVHLFVFNAENRSSTFLLVAGGIVLVLFLLSVAKYFVSHLTNKYRITTQRLFLIQGFLSRTTDEVELIRVDDIVVKQTLFERLCKIGTIVVETPSDRTHPRVELVGVQNPEVVKEMIRKYGRMRREKSALFVEQV